MPHSNPYYKIVNPMTGRRVSITGTLGKKILKTYGQYYLQRAGSEDSTEADLPLREKIQAHLKQLAKYQTEEFDRAEKLAQEAHAMEERAHQKLHRARRRIGKLVLSDRKKLKERSGDQPVCVLTKQTGTCEPNDSLSTKEYYHVTGKKYCQYNDSHQLCEFGPDGPGHAMAQKTRSELLQQYDYDDNFSGQDAIFWKENQNHQLEPFYSYHNPEELRTHVHGFIPKHSEESDSTDD